MNRAWKSYSKTHVKNIKYDSWISCNKQTNKWNNCNKQTNKSCNREKGCSKMFSGWEVFVPECDICKNFDTNEYLNIWSKTKMSSWTPVLSHCVAQPNLTELLDNQRNEKYGQKRKCPHEPLFWATVGGWVKKNHLVCGSIYWIIWLLLSLLFRVWSMAQ